MSDITPREPEDVHAHHDQSDPFERAAPEELSRQRDLLRDEVHELREQLRHSPTRARELENRVLQLQTSLATLSTQNERLVRTLKEAREQIVTLKSEVDRLAQPPSRLRARSSSPTTTRRSTSSPAAARCGSP